MTTVMRNDRDRRSGKPGMGHARKERVLLFGTRSADYIRASSQSGCIQRPNTWLHPNVSLNCPIFPLHRGRRPYMAHRVALLKFGRYWRHSGHWLRLGLDAPVANNPEQTWALALRLWSGLNKTRPGGRSNADHLST